MPEGPPTESFPGPPSSDSIVQLERKIADLRETVLLLVGLNGVLFAMVLLLLLLRVF